MAAIIAVRPVYKQLRALNRQTALMVLPEIGTHLDSLKALREEINKSLDLCFEGLDDASKLLSKSSDWSDKKFLHINGAFNLLFYVQKRSGITKQIEKQADELYEIVGEIAQVFSQHDHHEFAKASRTSFGGEAETRSTR